MHAVAVAAGDADVTAVPAAAAAAAEGESTAVAGMANGLHAVALAAEGQHCLLASFELRDRGSQQ